MEAMLVLVLVMAGCGFILFAMLLKAWKQNEWLKVRLYGAGNEVDVLYNSTCRLREMLGGEIDHARKLEETAQSLYYENSDLHKNLESLENEMDSCFKQLVRACDVINIVKPDAIRYVQMGDFEDVATNSNIGAEWVDDSDMDETESDEQLLARLASLKAACEEIIAADGCATFSGSKPLWEAYKRMYECQAEAVLRGLIANPYSDDEGWDEPDSDECGDVMTW